MPLLRAGPIEDVVYITSSNFCEKIEVSRHNIIYLYTFEIGTHVPVRLQNDLGFGNSVSDRREGKGRVRILVWCSSAAKGPSRPGEGTDDRLGTWRRAAPVAQLSPRALALALAG